MIKQKVKEELSGCLIQQNCKSGGILHLKNIYNKFTKEVQKNIDSNPNYSDNYSYLKETLFYFQEIKSGYYSNNQLQLDLFPFSNSANKKKN